MTEDEIIDKAEALPEHFAGRLTESALWSVRQMRGGGEYGLLTIEIAASLAKHHTPVTPEERDANRSHRAAQRSGLAAGTVRRLCVIVGFRWAWQEDTVSREERWTSPS
jgi:hypothetical protein